MFKVILQNLLKESNLTQSQLSRNADIPLTTISGWLNFNRLPDYNAIKKLANFFGVTTDFLLGQTDEWGNNLDTTGNNSLTDEEKEIVDMYRKLPPDLKRVIFATEKQFAKEQEENNQLFTAHKKY